MCLFESMPSQVWEGLWVAISATDWPSQTFEAVTKINMYVGLSHIFPAAEY